MIYEKNRAGEEISMGCPRGYMSSGVYILSMGMCLGGKCPGDVCPWGKCPGGTCSVLSPARFYKLFSLFSPLWS